MTEKKIYQAKQTVSEETCKDEILASIINSLNMLIARASSADMGMAARILHLAKEELVHWAVDMNFHETDKDHFINRHLYESGFCAMGELLARVSAMEDEKLKGEVVRMLGLSLMKPPQMVI